LLAIPLFQTIPPFRLFSKYIRNFTANKRIMKKVYHLGNCDTCQRIIATLDLKKKGFEFQNIKEEKITPAQLDEMVKLAGSHEALFSRIAMKYRALGLNTMTLTEKDYRKYILEEYTFLKRPVIISGKQIFIGNAKATIAAAAASL
jgi:arsenate reductase (glutaredoxin)